MKRVRTSSSSLEIMKFEIEKSWTAPYLGIVLALLIASGPGTAAPLGVEESAFAITTSSIGIYKPLVFFFVAIVTFANSFGRDIEQDVIMGELTLPVKKENLFLFKLISNYLFIFIADFISTTFSVWLVSASTPIVPIIAVLLADLFASLPFVSLSILISVVLRNRFSAVVITLAVYILHQYIIFLSFSTNLQIDPLNIMLRFLLLNGMTSYMYAILLANFSLALALFISAYILMVKVLQLD